MKQTGVNHKQDSTCSIGVIGAGPCGLSIIKNLQEQGLKNITVFEKNKEIGGNWVFNDNEGHSSVYETTHLISSKRLSEYPDFLMPDDYPEYPSHRQLLYYFNSYATHFNLYDYIQFNTTVIHVDRLEDGRWRVRYKNEEGLDEACFDYLLVANGHHWDPLVPEFSGTFTGAIMHSHQYKRASGFKDKRVLVVGGGNSACDVAVEISRVAKRTCVSMRRGYHIFPKFIFGKPTDVLFAQVRWIPSWLRQRTIGMVIRAVQGKYHKYGLMQPDCKPLEIHPTINSELLYFIRHGKIATKTGIDRFDGDKVYFTDGSYEEFDTVILATGYKISFPFFDSSFIDFSALHQVPLYRKMLHPDYGNLFFIGLFQPQGCIWPLADYQAKIAAQMIAGTLKRPSDIAKKLSYELKNPHYNFKPHTRHAIEVDFHKYKKELLDLLEV